MTTEDRAGLKRWRVWGRVAGPILPTDPISIGQMRLGVSSTPSLLPDAPRLTATPQGYSGYTTSPSETTVVSPCAVWIDVEAPTVDEALSRVELSSFPILAVALSLRSEGEAYRIEPVGYQTEDTGNSVSPVISACYFEKAEMTGEQSRQVSEDFAELLTDASQKAALNFARGLALSDMGVDPATSSAALLAFYQSIEVIAYKIPWVRPDGYEQDRKRLFSSLQRDLYNNTLSFEKRELRVREMVKAMDRLDAKYLNLRIDYAAMTLGMSALWKYSAKEFGKLRNRRLGHSGGAVAAELNSWLIGTVTRLSARNVSQEFLTAYIDWLQAKRQS